MSQMQTESGRELLTAREVAERYKLASAPSARLWLKRHHVSPWNRHGRRRLYLATDVEAAFRGEDQDRDMRADTVSAVPARP